MMHDIRVIIAMWLLERAVDIAPKPEQDLLAQGTYLVTRAMIEGRQTLETTYFGSAPPPQRKPPGRAMTARREV